MVAKKQIQPESFLQFKFLNSPSFSPDGKRIAFVVMAPTWTATATPAICTWRTATAKTSGS